MYTAITSDNVDVITAFSTDGLLQNKNQEQYDKSGNCRSDLTAERNRENGGDDCDRIIHGKCKRVDGCGKRGFPCRNSFFTIAEG